MMPAEDFVRLVVSIDERRRDWQTLLDDDELGLRFHALVEDAQLELVLREFRIPPGISG
jgi:hypothetical protein